MSRAFMVPGPTLLKSGTGASAALEALGLAWGGVRVAITMNQRPVRSDAAGPDEAADLQRFGSHAEIRCRLADYDDTLLMKLMALAEGNATEGVGGTPGSLIGAGGSSYRLVLSNANKPYRFTNATLSRDHLINLSSEQAYPEIVWNAWRLVSAGDNTVAGKTLYDHTDA